MTGLPPLYAFLMGIKNSNLSRMKQLLTLLVFCLTTATVLQAQVVTTKPQVSPKAKVVQTVGITDVAVMYHRPFVKDRELWGSLVPYDQIWRVGANENTVIYFSDGVKIEGKALDAGKYSLHMIPGKEDWTVIFNKNYKSWGSYAYDEAEDALRVEVKPIGGTHHYEMMTFRFEDVTPESATCMLSWGKLSVPFSISVNTHELVVANLREELQTQAGWTWIGWHEAAAYCLANNVNLDEGYQWASRSVFMAPSAQNMQVKAQLAAKMKGDESQAKQVMLKTLQKDLETHAVTWKEYDGLAKFASQKLEDNETALAWSKKSVEMSPNMTNMMAYAGLLEKMDKAEKATKVKEEAIAKGTNAELNAYGYQLLFAGDTEGAVKIFEINAERNPADPNVWDSLGEGYVNNGQKEKAIKALKKSLSMDPPDNVKANSMKLLRECGVEPGQSGS